MSNVHDEEEEDYMSEAFLNRMVQESGNDKAKKANITYSERRRQKQLEHLANLPKPLHVREKEAREKGLEKEIGEENKGMAMLLKMGFKKGGTLGAPKPFGDSSSMSSPAPASVQKTERDDLTNGRSDVLRAPLAIQIKQGRGGLGLDSSKKRKAEEEFQQHQKEVQKVFDEGYRGQKRSQFELEKRKRQLGAARGICMRMDAAAAKERAAKEAVSETKSSVDQEYNRQDGKQGRSNAFWWIDDSVPDEILGTHLMGAGAEAVAQELGADKSTAGQRTFDLDGDEDGDPEDKREKRVKLDPVQVVEDEEPAKWGERPEFTQLEVHEKLDRVVKHLRDEYRYCFWCSAQYYGAEDIAENCPGESEDDH
ncbi:hypothetical protein BGZ58_005062 [Dissophora ornata]|nr:hypothetical protein BGZ58_005062 [Dissophora ornata]